MGKYKKVSLVSFRLGDSILFEAGGGYGNFTTDLWRKYLLTNPVLDQNSPMVAKSRFIKIYKDFHLSTCSPAKFSGAHLSHTFINPEHDKIIIGYCDFEGNAGSTVTPSLSAYEFFQDIK